MLTNPPKYEIKLSKIIEQVMKNKVFFVTPHYIRASRSINMFFQATEEFGALHGWYVITLHERTYPFARISEPFRINGFVRPDSDNLTIIKDGIMYKKLYNAVEQKLEDSDTIVMKQDLSYMLSDTSDLNDMKDVKSMLDPRYNVKHGLISLLHGDSPDVNVRNVFGAY